MSDLAGIDVTQVDDSAKYDINRVYRIKHPTYGGGAWLYGQADAAIDAGEWVQYVSADGGMALLTSTIADDDPVRVGVADVDIAST